MKNLLAVRTYTPWTGLLLIIAGFTFMLVWLPLLRCPSDGASYRWAQGYFGLSFSSVGLSWDYLVLVLFLILYTGLFYSAFWATNRKVFYAFLAWWWIHAFGNLLYQIYQDGDTMFHGETLNVHVSLKSIVYSLSLVVLVLIIVVIVKDRKLPSLQIPWSAVNRRKAWIILGPLAVQILMFATGTPDGVTDQIAVVIAILQAILIPIIFFPNQVAKPDGLDSV